MKGQKWLIPAITDTIPRPDEYSNPLPALKAVLSMTMTDTGGHPCKRVQESGAVVVCIPLAVLGDRGARASTIWGFLADEGLVFADYSTPTKDAAVWVVTRDGRSVPCHESGPYIESCLLHSSSEVRVKSECSGTAAPHRRNVWERLGTLYRAQQLSMFMSRYVVQPHLDSLRNWVRTFRAIGMTAEDFMTYMSEFLPEVSARLACALDKQGPGLRFDEHFQRGLQRVRPITEISLEANLALCAFVMQSTSVSSFVLQEAETIMKHPASAEDTDPHKCALLKRFEMNMRTHSHLKTVPCVTSVRNVTDLLFKMLSEYDTVNCDALRACC